MMGEEEFSDETLMAYADGELDAATAAKIDAAVAASDALAARVALFAETRKATKGAFEAIRAEPVPAGLQASVERLIAERTAGTKGSDPASNIVRLGPPRSAARDRGRTWRLPLAASIAAAAAGLAGYWIGMSGDRPDGLLDVAGSTHAEIARLRSSVRSGEQMPLPGQSARLEVVSSFLAGGVLCREFELDRDGGAGSLAVACLKDGKWSTSFAVVMRSDGGGFVPASSLEAVESYLSSIGAGAALSPEQEEQALARMQQ
jgi:hypothetical protein